MVLSVRMLVERWLGLLLKGSEVGGLTGASWFLVGAYLSGIVFGREAVAVAMVFVARATLLLRWSVGALRERAWQGRTLWARRRLRSSRWRWLEF